MSKQANKTVIGLFVVVAIAMAIAAVVVFGSGKFFTRRDMFVAFFEGSVKGLRAGAPVTFRGVPIGQVKSIQVVYNRKDLSFWIPVVLEVNPESVEDLGTYAQPAREHKQREMLIKAGLRAQLDMQSLVTGQLLVNLDFHPDKPARLVKQEIPDLHIPYDEIPTIKTPLQEISETIQEFPLQEIAKDISRSLRGIERLVNSPKLADSLDGVNETVNELKGLAQNMNSRVDRIGDSLDLTIKDTRTLISRLNEREETILTDLDQTLLDARKLVNNLNNRTQLLSSSLQTTLDTAQASLVQARKTLRTFENTVGENSPIRYELSDALNEIAGAARSLRVLADYLEQNPDALLRGKNPSGGRQ